MMAPKINQSEAVIQLQREEEAFLLVEFGKRVTCS